MKELKKDLFLKMLCLTLYKCTKAVVSVQLYPVLQYSTYKASVAI